MNPAAVLQENAALDPVAPGESGLTELYARLPSYREAARACAVRARAAFRAIRRSPNPARSGALRNLAALLEDPARRAAILAENQKDTVNAARDGLRANLIDRLTITEKRLDEMVQALREIATMPDPLGEVIDGRRLPAGIDLIQKRVPLGTILTIYESRPNVTVDIGALCLKSGNAAILRGGREALHSNRALFALFRQAIEEAGLPGDALQLVEEPDRAYLLALLELEDVIDLVVPRGGEALIQFVTRNSRIPVVKHDKGVCNMYVDRSADLSQALPIVINAKLQRTSVCNSIENLLIHVDFPHARELLTGVAQAGARLLGDEATLRLIPGAQPIVDPDAEYGTEYLDERLSVKIVASLDEAVDFIYRYGSSHSECILARDWGTIRAFQDAVDSAAVFVNCSTRFHDGGQMGKGAEVGISTGRLHVRGPMGLRDLTTTTYVVTGEGQIRQ